MLLLIDEINDVQMMYRGLWVIESVFLHSPDKGVWACLYTFRCTKRTFIIYLIFCSGHFLNLSGLLKFVKILPCWNCKYGKTGKT